MLHRLQLETTRVQQHDEDQNKMNQSWKQIHLMSLINLYMFI